MRKRAAFIALLVFLVSLCACTGKDQYEQAGSKFVEQMANKQFEDAVSTFDETMAGLISPEKLEELWGEILEKSGTFQKQLSTRRETFVQYEIVYVTCQFDNGILDVKVVYDTSKQIAGLFFVPTEKK